jgi:hypothetical protein
VQAVVVAIAATALVGFDHKSVGYAYAGVVGLAGLVIWSATRVRINDRVAHSPRQLAAAGIFFGLVGAAFGLIATSPHRPLGGHHSAESVYVMTLLFALAVAALYVSSLIDWFYTGPRLRAEKRPCTDSLSATWRTVTRIWLLHRVIAALMFVGATIAIVAVAASHWITNLNQVVAGALAAAATVLAGFYLSRFPLALGVLINPPICVGDKVRLAEPFAHPESCPFYYVADVSVEGVKLVELAAGDIPAAPDQPASHDRILELSEVHKLLRGRSSFSPCDVGACKGVNSYCWRLPLWRAKDHVL